MSDVAKGAQRVRAVERKLWTLGYRTAIVSRSGQRRGARADSLAFDGDLIALAPADSTLPHLVVEVGGIKKSVAESLREMTAQPLPAGFIPIVARLVNSHAGVKDGGWRWHTSSREAHDTITELLEATS